MGDKNEKQKSIRLELDNMRESIKQQFAQLQTEIKRQINHEEE